LGKSQSIGIRIRCKDRRRSYPGLLGHIPRLAV